MIAVLVRNPAHMTAWMMDNQAKIKTRQRVKNQFTMNDGKIYRLFVVCGTIDVIKLQGYDWEKIIIQYGYDNERWRDNCTMYVRQYLNIDPKLLEYQE